MKISLYQIDQQLQDVLSAADENGEIDAEAFDKLQIAKKDKQLGIVKYMNHLAGVGKMIKDEIDRLKTLESQAKKRHEWLSGYLMDSMNLEGVKELDFEIFKAKVVKNPPKVVIDNIGIIPPKFLLTTMEVTTKKDELKEALKEGEIPGCHLEQGERLRIS